MPYYFGEDSPGWEEYIERLEAENLARGPLDHFTYVEPWEAKTSVLHFSRAPRTASAKAVIDQGARRPPGIIARIFGAKPPEGLKPPAEIEVGSAEWLSNFQAEQKRRAEEALERVAVCGGREDKFGQRRLQGPRVRQVVPHGLSR